MFLKKIVFSTYSTFGPVPILSYPDNSNMILDIKDELIDEKIAIKSISILLDDYYFEKLDAGTMVDKEDEFIIGVIPYPDFKLVALTAFSYLSEDDASTLIPATLSFIAEEHHRAFLFDNFFLLKEKIKTVFEQIKTTVFQDFSVLTDNKPYLKSCFTPLFSNLYQKFSNVQGKPLVPLLRHRRIKILFAGLDNTGKTSFLFALNRKYSKIIGLKPSIKANKEPLNFLGTTIINWDIPGQKAIREKVLKKSEVYLFETDILYFFIDVVTPRLDETKDYLHQIVVKYDESNGVAKIPIIFVLSKADEDIIGLPHIQHSIHNIQKEIQLIMQQYDHPFQFFMTSIFKSSTIISAISYGIRQLSPNRDLIESIIRNLLKTQDLNTGFILNVDGIPLSISSNTDLNLNKPKNYSQPLENYVFEIIATHFTHILNGFEKEWNLFRVVENDLVLIRKFTINSEEFFLLLYTNQEKYLKQSLNLNYFIDKFNGPIEKLFKKITPLLQYYLS